MAFRPTPFLAAGVLLVTGLVEPLACNATVDEQRGNIGQQCFADDQNPCNPGLKCVLLPLEAGGNDGGECFDLDASEASTAPAEDAATDVVTADASDAGEEDSALESGPPEAASDAPIDVAEDEPIAEASTDAKTD